jgi:hypothetical protein
VTDDELAAVIAAIQALTQSVQTAETTLVDVSRWKRAARLEAAGADV